MHWFHNKCIKNWSDGKRYPQCPICRLPVVYDKNDSDKGQLLNRPKRSRGGGGGGAAPRGFGAPEPLPAPRGFGAPDANVTDNRRQRQRRAPQVDSELLSSDDTFVHDSEDADYLDGLDEADREEVLIERYEEFIDGFVDEAEKEENRIELYERIIRRREAARPPRPPADADSDSD